jgi:hypothetical protein
MGASRYGHPVRFAGLIGTYSRCQSRVAQPSLREAPSFFPLWDRAIAKAYGLSLQPSGQNGDSYLRFMRTAGEQAKQLTEFADPLKALDEYNYCLYTKGWVTQDIDTTGSQRSAKVCDRTDVVVHYARQGTSQRSPGGCPPADPDPSHRSRRLHR